ncbi:multiple sugar transport system ATP-binding protein [Halorubrum alkaliphilum]|uniref:ABC-type D-xylose/L-arabinose transporter n=1 Tax=Halorubrum alkaliphilum TaxID=261290 RepID=A0A8T4GBI3_9EURY|nr:ATP-binding cassette domain-containing protein [Halorubrum alkaliphilum]MBP1921774.1 multiple sugar transport system ATP-binding protein [Halorubrum alkaliphilum]
MARLELDSVTKRFGEGDGSVLAVDDVNVDIADGEFLVLVGPSGCGKSTTLRMVAGLESITDGEIRLDDQRINDQAPAERDIAMVFQSYALYPHMTVRENMRFGLEESTDLPADERNARVEETAGMLDITELLDRKPGALSGGQRQRVALGRAIVREPKAFLMDEPLSNLDAKLRSQMRTELQQLQEDLDTTTVYVTHDQTEAMTMGDRIAILDAGELQQVATPLEAYHRPANRFVGSFIGEPSMNFVDCGVDDGALLGEFEVPVDGPDESRIGLTADDEDDRQLETVEFRYPLGADVRDAVAGSAEAALGIRPEDVLIEPVTADDESDAAAAGASPLGDAAADHVFGGIVTVVEPMGDENVVHVTLDDGPELVATVNGLRRIDSGTRVRVGLPADAIHVFDGDTGEAVHSRSLDDAELDERRV